MNIEFSVAVNNLQKLIGEFSPFGQLSNEAQTRFSFIDRLLQTCLGWNYPDAIKVEVFESGERTDYECGNPRQLIIEAKKASIPFKFPPRGAKASARVNLRSLSSFDNTLKLAIEQAQTYCQSRGVQYAAISNGPQLVIFLATRLDGKSPLDGDSLVFTSYEDLVKGFRIIFGTLTPDGIKEKRLTDILGASEIEALPPKLSVNCLDYFQYKYASEFQENLKNAASLVVEDLGKVCKTSLPLNWQTA